MIYTNRDYGISTIKARSNHSCYGMGLGIMILDEVYPGFPGDVRNASAFPFPIQYLLKRTHGLTASGLQLIFIHTFSS